MIQYDSHSAKLSYLDLIHRRILNSHSNFSGSHFVYLLLATNQRRGCVQRARALHEFGDQLVVVRRRVIDEEVNLVLGVDELVNVVEKLFQEWSRLIDEQGQ